MREALFSILHAQGRIVGARVLDLYAGTGALALDALSRGADRAALVESGRDALAAIRANVASLGVEDRARVIAVAVERASAQLAADAPFDLVFADPPYADLESAAHGIAALVTAGVFADGAVLVLEHSSKSTAPEIPGLAQDAERGTRRYGDTAVTFYSRA